MFDCRLSLMAGCSMHTAMLQKTAAAITAACVCALVNIYRQYFWLFQLANFSSQAVWGKVDIW